MKVLFMGTPEIAAEVLQAIIDSNHEVVCVVSQEDKPKGRGKELMPTPVKVLAMEHNIPVFQPHRIKTEDSIQELKKYDADIYVVIAYGQILSKEILDIPKYGCINVHASLLPKYRGCAPIQYAVIEGDKITGVTIQQMDEGVDTGDMLFKSTVEVDDKETSDSLYDKLAACGASLIGHALDAIEKGDTHPIKQDDSLATHTKMITKAQGHLTFDIGAAATERLIRGFNSWPGTYAYINGKSLKIWEADVLDEDSDGAPGTVSSASDGRLIINTNDKKLEITSLQLEGKKRMDTKSFLLGYKINKGDVLE